MEMVQFVVAHCWLMVCLLGFAVCVGYVIIADVHASRVEKVMQTAPENIGLSQIIVRDFLGIDLRARGSMLVAAILATVFFVLFVEQVIQALMA